ncbi:AbgT family transporter [Gilvimarinus polysaccharolyticus]|uniref:AbgT family transporter n=1 Tax=Gilvimarinus polysaccharolyticus TaxID=863921 RepID=UPI000673BD58|nr:AbgT family transporter [Gilvimarinus polysaccharolyticus]
MTSTTTVSRFKRFLIAVERIGNRLPSPALLFVWLAALIAAASCLASAAGWQVSLPSGVVEARNIVSADGLRWALATMVDNFVGFAPVGAVLVTMLGLGVAEHSGLLRCVLLRLVRRARGPLLSFMVVLAGILSNLAFDVGYVLLIPLAGVLFQLAGRPPLAGIAAAFAGVSAGYSANLLLGPADVILAGITQEAMAGVASGYQVSVASNYYFTAASTLVLALMGAWVTERWVAPFLMTTSAPGLDVEQDAQELAAIQETPDDVRALWAVAGWTLFFAGWVLWASVAIDAPLRSVDGTLELAMLVPLIAIYAAIAGLIFGRLSKRYQAVGDMVAGMEAAMTTLASYLVIMFFAAQCVAWFNWTGLGALIAASGAALLSGLEGQSVLLLMGFIMVSAMINLFVGSASAKWALLAPVFVPMLYLLGVSPEQAQMAYRIGDSSTNIITPLMPYFAVVVAFAARYRKNCGMGTLAAMMLPYSLSFLLGWSVLFAVWLLIGLPLGPQA